MKYADDVSKERILSEYQIDRYMNKEVKEEEVKEEKEEGVKEETKEEDEKEEDLSEDEAITMENLRDLVEGMLFQELYKRRCDHRRCCRRFFK